MRSLARKPLVLLLSLLLLVGGIVWGWSILFRGELGTYPIEGVWLNSYYSQCLCGAHNFFDFSEGTITLYSDRHETDPCAGEYEALEDGSYRVILFATGKPDQEWVVRPGPKSWLAPPDRKESWTRRKYLRFKRPKSDERERKLIAEAPVRDSQLREQRRLTEFQKHFQVE